MGTTMRVWVMMTTFLHLRKSKGPPTRRPRWRRLTDLGLRRKSVCFRALPHCPCSEILQFSSIRPCGCLHGTFCMHVSLGPITFAREYPETAFASLVEYRYRSN